MHEVYLTTTLLKWSQIVISSFVIEPQLVGKRKLNKDKLEG
jgi:hypothetical protein